jgi:CubicO group peptidase (beta-lactamase class C family)
MGQCRSEQEGATAMTFPQVFRWLRRFLLTLPLALTPGLSGHAAGDALPEPSGKADSTASVSPAVAAHIQHIEASILGPVLVEGVHTTPRTLAQRMQDLHVPGVSIAVIHDGRIEWARGFGVSSVDGEQVRTDTLFQAGSISKPVTAMAVLRLVQAGKLDLDIDVNQYLKTWKIPENHFTEQKKVTLRELITHTAGLTVHGFPGYAQGAPVPTLVQVLNGEAPANSPAIRVDTLPGSVWRYSGGGYVVTQLMLNDVTGEPFPKLMHDTVLAPIGMTHSTYEQPLPAKTLLHAATPYDQNGAPVQGGPHIYPEMAPAGLWTTPSDLARFAIEIQKSLVGQANRVLTKSMTTEMVKPGGLGNWGLGLQLGGKPDHPNFGHSGADEGFMSNLVAYNDGDGLAVMANGANGGELANDITRTVAHEYGWPDFQPIEKTAVAVNPGILSGYVGQYQVGPYLVVTIAREGDRLFWHYPGEPKSEMFPASEKEWFLADIDVQDTFETDSQGNAAQVTTRQNGRQTLLGKRIDDAEASRITTELATRVKNQTPQAGIEVVLRRDIDEMLHGAPQYDHMSAGLAGAVRQQLPQLQSIFGGLGPVQNISFRRVEPDGSNVYDIKFANGNTEWHVLLGADGKVEGEGFRPIP